MGTGPFPGVKRPWRNADHPPSSSAEVKERIGLYFFFSFGPSWPVLRWPLPLPLRFPLYSVLLKYRNDFNVPLFVPFFSKFPNYWFSLRFFYFFSTFSLLLLHIFLLFPFPFFSNSISFFCVSPSYFVLRSFPFILFLSFFSSYLPPFAPCTQDNSLAFLTPWISPSSYDSKQQ